MVFLSLHQERAEYTNPVYFLSYRFFIAFITINLLRVFWGDTYKTLPAGFKELFSWVWSSSVLYFILENAGVSLSASSEAGILLSTIPIFVMILARIFLKEKIALPRVLSILTALAGILLITAGKGLSSGGTVLGPVLLLGSTLTAAMYNILSRKASAKFTPWEITYHMMTAGFSTFFTMALVLSLLRGEPFEYLSQFLVPSVFNAALYLGTLSSVGAFFLINLMLSKLEASRATVFAYLSTVVSLLAGIIVRGERFLTVQIFGVILILFGVWGANALSRKRLEGMK